MLLGKEFKFLFHIPAIDGVRNDIHIIKEKLHYDNGKTVPNLKIVKDYKIPFYITQQHKRNHKDKKEYEDIENLVKYVSTVSDLPANAAIRLGINKYKPTMRDVAMSPYLYGADTSSWVHIKKAYVDKYPDLHGDKAIYDVCGFDIETLVTTGEIIIISIATHDKLFVAINRCIVLEHTDLEDKLNSLYNEHMPKTDITNNIKKEYLICDTEVDLILETFKRLHLWQPDFVEVWNIDFDVPYVLNVLKKNNIDPKNVFCDPSLPDNYKVFDYQEGQKHRTTEAGVFKPLKYFEQWHTVYAPASFYWIDGMCAYYFLRPGSKKIVGGYGLDSILSIVLGNKYKKLKIPLPGTEGLAKYAWFKIMAEKYPLHFIIYNIWDTISMLHADDVTRDLKFDLPMQSGLSPFNVFNSNPKRSVNSLYYFYKENGGIISTKAPIIVNDKILGLDKWIAILPSYNVKDNGVKNIKGAPTLATNIRGHNRDADQEAGYPSNEEAGNVSKATTEREVIDIAGIDKDIFKLQNINSLFGTVNSLEYCTTMYNFPNLLTLKKNIATTIKQL